MRFFVYGRKSVYRDNSDSIDNQFKKCREYCEVHFPGQIDSWEEFSDEAFTGADTNRPDYQRMMDLIRDGQCDVLVVYMLDRFSRNVKDFSAAYTELQKHHVYFVCLDLNIDTSTPMGEAMMYISSVFAQMERQNIALRVADNMTNLAKKGYWVGGNPPLGYVRSRIVVDGRKHVTIVKEPEGVRFVTWVFDTFLASGLSLQGLETKFKREEVKTINGCHFSSTQIYAMLTSPFCCEATPEVYDYYAAKGCKMESPRELWDGSVGVMIYGRTTEKNKKHEKAPCSEWSVCLGLHEPFIPAEKWLAAQAQFGKNTFNHKKTYDVSLLRGTLRCSCGSLMAVSHKKKVDGSASSWYYCVKRMRKGSEACNARQIKTESLDNKVLEVFENICADSSQIEKYVEKSVDAAPDLKGIQRKISSAEDKIGKLAASLSMAEGSAASKYIIAEMEKLDAELEGLKKERSAAERTARINKAEKKSNAEKVKEIKDLMAGLSGFTAEEKNKIVNAIVKQCTWDGETLFLML